MNKFTRGALLATGLTASALGTAHSVDSMLHHQEMEAIDANIAFGLEIDQYENPEITADEIKDFRDNEAYHAKLKNAAIYRLAASLFLAVSIVSISANYRSRRIEKEIRDETTEKLVDGINLVHNELQRIYHDVTTKVLNGEISREEAELIFLDLAASDLTSTDEDVA